MRFPVKRPRRLRKDSNIRRLVRDVKIGKSDFIYPIFVKEGLDEKEEISSMSGQYHHSLDSLEKEIIECEGLDIPAVMIFGIPEDTDERGSSAYDEQGIVQRAVRRIKETSNIEVFTDVCLCHYTSHGHCGMIRDGELQNDETLEILDEVALSHAQAGADFVAPSSMIDGQVASIRETLDKEGYEDIGIMSYSAKFASNYYGPFRDAAESCPEDSCGLEDRTTYQMDYQVKGRGQPIEEIRMDLEEGADIVMVKPALPYLDIISKASETLDVPMAAYSVSGEYQMLKSSVENNIFCEEVLDETLYSIKRAGADIIITYFAKEMIKNEKI